MQHGSKTLSSFGGSVESSRGVGTCTKAHGSWRLWAHGPLLVGDPDKFLSLVGEHAHFIASLDLLQLGPSISVPGSGSVRTCSPLVHRCWRKSNGCSVAGC